MKTLVFDVDDTLANLKEPMMAMLNSHTGKNMHWSEWWKLDVVALYGITDETLFSLMLETEIVTHVKPFESSARTLEALSNRGYDIQIVTARGWHPQGKEITEAWLNKHNIPFNDVHLINIGSSKLDPIEKMGDVLLAVDDNVKHCYEFHDHDMIHQAVVINQPWNTDVVGPRRINEIHDVLDIIKEYENEQNRKE